MVYAIFNIDTDELIFESEDKDEALKKFDELTHASPPVAMMLIKVLAVRMGGVE
jgi:hypothetical protein